MGRARPLARIGLLLALLPVPARAGGSAFLPRVFENGAYLDVLGTHEEDDNRPASRHFYWRDTFLREKATVFSNGYFYHPRFLQYRLSLTGALKQEWYEQRFSRPEGTTRKRDGGFEYDARLIGLPGHAYDLELFARRFEPLFREQAAQQRRALQNSQGVSFRYRRKPWFAHARFGHDSVESGEASTDVKRLNLDGEYFRRFRSGREVSFDAHAAPASFDTSAGLSGRSGDYQAGNRLDLGRLRLHSSLSRNTFDQDADGSRFENRQWLWYELMSVHLPWGFRTDVTWRDQSNEGLTRDRLSERRLEDSGHNLRADVVHKLYQSVDTIYSFQTDRRRSPSGETSADSHALSISYTKRIPGGRLLLGLNGSRGDTENRGATELVNEPHPATAVPGSFRIARPNVAPESITLHARSPVAPFEQVRLFEGAHFRVIPVGDAVEVQVFALPAPFTLPGTYDLLVSAAFLAGEFGLRSDARGGSVSLELFENLLIPYLSYQEIGSEVTSGSFPGTPLDTETTTAGLRVHRGPLRAVGEYQKQDWSVAPSRTWKAELQYVGSLSRTTRLYAAATRQDRRFTQGSSALSADPYTDGILSATGNLQQTLFSKALVLAAGGSYWRLRGRTESDSSSLNASLSWTVGRLVFEAGASAYRSDSQTSAALESSRDHQFYYLKLRRNLK